MLGEKLRQCADLEFPVGTGNFPELAGRSDFIKKSRGDRKLLRMCRSMFDSPGSSSPCLLDLAYSSPYRPRSACASAMTLLSISPLNIFSRSSGELTGMRSKTMESMRAWVVIGLFRYFSEYCA